MTSYVRTNSPAQVRSLSTFGKHLQRSVLTAARLTTWKRRAQVGVMTPNSMEMWGSQPSTRMRVCVGFHRGGGQSSSPALVRLDECPLTAYLTIALALVHREC